MSTTILVFVAVIGCLLPDGAVSPATDSNEVATTGLTIPTHWMAIAGAAAGACAFRFYNWGVVKRLIRFVGLVAVASAIVWLTREHLLPTPHVSHEPPPHYRSTPPPPQAAADDLSEIKGIGPVFATKLEEVGIRSFRGLSEVAPSTITDTIGVSPKVATDWVNQAQARLA